MRQTIYISTEDLRQIMAIQTQNIKIEGAWFEPLFSHSGEFQVIRAMIEYVPVQTPQAPQEPPKPEGELKEFKEEIK
jgi:hypothetical protein